MEGILTTSHMFSIVRGRALPPWPASSMAGPRQNGPSQGRKSFLSANKHGVVRLLQFRARLAQAVYILINTFVALPAYNPRQYQDRVYIQKTKRWTAMDSKILHKQITCWLDFPLACHPETAIGAMPSWTWVDSRSGGGGKKTCVRGRLSLGTQRWIDSRYGGGYRCWRRRSGEGFERTISSKLLICFQTKSHTASLFLQVVCWPTYFSFPLSLHCFYHIKWFAETTVWVRERTWKGMLCMPASTA